MRKHFVLVATLAVLTVPDASVAQLAETSIEDALLLATQPPKFDSLAEFNYALVFPEEPLRPAEARPTQELLGMIASWLGANFELPVSNDLPRVELVAPAKLSALRYRGLVSDRQAHPAVDDRQIGPLAEDHEVYAVYDDAGQTIYLPEGWQGVTPAEISVLVHEMVHHLQNVAKLKYGCPQEREKPA